MNKIKIDQIAIGVRTPDAKSKIEAITSILGSTDWIHDTVIFDGVVDGKEVIDTKANLNFNYDLVPGIEFEILEFVEGDNWHNYRSSSNEKDAFISHFGFHVKDAEEFDSIRKNLSSMDIEEIQFAKTKSHANKNVPEDRSYEYVIFNTYVIFGFDLKMILRTVK